MAMAIMHRQKSTKPPAMIVVIIASILRLSQMIPTMPTIKAARNEKIISSPPRALRGLPQPG
jgi:hypothetical protein